MCKFFNVKKTTQYAETHVHIFPCKMQTILLDLLEHPEQPKGPDILNTKSKNERVWHHFKQNQVKTKFVRSSFQGFETACQRKTLQKSGKFQRKLYRKVQ